MPARQKAEFRSRSPVADRRVLLREAPAFPGALALLEVRARAEGADQRGDRVHVSAPACGVAFALEPRRLCSPRTCRLGLPGTCRRCPEYNSSPEGSMCASSRRRRRRRPWGRMAPSLLRYLGGTRRHGRTWRGSRRSRGRAEFSWARIRFLAARCRRNASRRKPAGSDCSKGCVRALAIGFARRGRRWAGEKPKVRAHLGARRSLVDWRRGRADRCHRRARPGAQ